uniref:Uncharacterized protein n=1 Tax=Ignisphaera aggregans TaxID=334771 RepID=A0A7C2ZNL7_9CREN
MPEKGGASQQKSKELKTFSVQVITPEHIKRDKRKLIILKIIRNFNEISEKGLLNLVSILKDEKGINLGYTVAKVGNRVIVKELQEDIRALLYTGLVEVNPKNKKLRLTSNGLEFLDSIAGSVTIDNLDAVMQAVEELKPRIQLLDEEVTLLASSKR